MTDPLRRVALAAAVTSTAAAVLLTGCSASHHDKAGATAHAAKTAGAGSTASKPVDPGKDDKPAGPKIPKSKLTPATGTFTAAQRAYLAGRVPKGTDPAAVLQLGQETCQRLTEVAKTSRDAAIGGIITGQIEGVKGATDHLCPKDAPLLDAAERGFADGSYTVASTAKAGSRITPGTYRALTPTKSCSWQAGSRRGTAHTVTITRATGTFTSEGCFAWAPAGS
jgi:hypothetical protein